MLDVAQKFPDIALERARTDRLLSMIGSLGLDPFLRDGGGEVELQDVEESGVGLGQGEPDRLLVRRLAARDGRRRAVDRLVVAGDRVLFWTAMATAFVGPSTR